MSISSISRSVPISAQNVFKQMDADITIFKTFSEQIRGDLDVAFSAVRGNGQMFRYVSDSAKNNPILINNIIRKVLSWQDNVRVEDLRKDLQTHIDAHPALLNDLVQLSAFNIEFTSAACKKDFFHMLHFIEKNPQVLEAVYAGQDPILQTRALLHILAFLDLAIRFHPQLSFMYAGQEHETILALIQYNGGRPSDQIQRYSKAHSRAST